MEETGEPETVEVSGHDMPASEAERATGPTMAAGPRLREGRADGDAAGVGCGGRTRPSRGGSEAGQGAGADAADLICIGPVHTARIRVWVNQSLSPSQSMIIDSESIISR